jgi:hypothetical protein
MPPEPLSTSFSERKIIGKRIRRCSICSERSAEKDSAALCHEDVGVQCYVRLRRSS